jgi:1,4-dihydroxy-2-naphthoate octaprenyltransferase
MSTLTPWIKALRPRTLTLALACIGMGCFMAQRASAFDLKISLLCFFTAVLLQILSNLANDYGDFTKGTDNEHRTGPQRALQSGKITVGSMKTAIAITAILCLASGIWLLAEAMKFIPWQTALVFLVIGFFCILAAIKYTAGKNPYGYKGFGDVFVFICFGIVGVAGTYYLQAQHVNDLVFLPAFACGFFSMAVLNINNMRDIHNDKAAGKITIPVRLGSSRAKVYHLLLLSSGFICAVAYTLLTYERPWQWLFLVSLPLLLSNISNIRKHPPEKLDPYLKQMALTTLLFVLSFGIGMIV